MLLGLEYRNRFLARIGISLIRIALVGIVLSLLVLGGTLMQTMLVALLVLLLILTLFSLLASPEFMQFFSNSGALIDSLAKYMPLAITVLCISAIVLIVALIFVHRDKNWAPARKSITLTKVMLIIIAILGIIVLILFLGTASGGQV